MVPNVSGSKRKTCFLDIGELTTDARNLLAECLEPPQNSCWSEPGVAPPHSQDEEQYYRMERAMWFAWALFGSFIAGSLFHEDFPLQIFFGITSRWSTIACRHRSSWRDCWMVIRRCIIRIIIYSLFVLCFLSLIIDTHIKIPKNKKRNKNKRH